MSVFLFLYVKYIFLLDSCGLRFERLQNCFSDTKNEIYLLFYGAVLQSFISFNKFLQREDPLIPVISEQIKRFLVKLASKFVVSNIRTANEDLGTLQYANIVDQFPGMFMQLILVFNYI